MRPNLPEKMTWPGTLAWDIRILFSQRYQKEMITTLIESK